LSDALGIFLHINEGPKGCFLDQESMDGDVNPKLTAVRENSKVVERFISFSEPSTLVQGGINTGKMNILCCLCMLTEGPTISRNGTERNKLRHYFQRSIIISLTIVVYGHAELS